MCGIAGFHRLNGKPIERAGWLADTLLLGIEHRGRHATGIFCVADDGEVLLDKRAMRATNFIKKRSLFPSNPRTVLLHTRWATTGTYAKKDAHPLISGKMAAIHNGTVRNADQIFEAFNLPRLAQVDSEVIPAMIDFAGWDKAEQALSLMEGAVATAVSNHETGELILARVRSTPLVYTVANGLLIFASTEQAIRYAWDKTYNKPLPRGARMVRLVPGEIVRVNGKVEHGQIPGVFGVETEPVWTPYKPKPAKQTKPKARPKAATGVKASKRSKRRKPKGGRSSKALALRQPREMTRAEKGLRAMHALTTEYTITELDEYLTALARVQMQEDEDDQLDLFLDPRLRADDADDSLFYEYAPGRFYD